MSKIANVRLPNVATQQYSPEQFNQLVRSLEQIVFQLNNSYTSQATSDPQVSLDWFSGAVGPANRSILEDRNDFAYGAFADFNTQAASTVNTATAITWGTTAYSKHVSVGSPTSRIVFTRSGLYKVDFSAELHSESASAKTYYFWPRINGTDVTGSTMVNVITDNDHRKTVSRTGMFRVNAGDYLEAMFAVDDLDADLHGLAATAFAPATPSVTLTVLGVDYG